LACGAGENFATYLKDGISIVYHMVRVYAVACLDFNRVSILIGITGNG